MNVETFSTITVDKNISYWMFVLSDINWEDLKKNLMKDVFYITSFGLQELKSNDIVFVYQKHTTNLKLHGFVCVFQIDKNIGLNKMNIKIFKDVNMSKYISSIIAIELFTEPYKISSIEHILKKECPNVFTSYTSFNLKYTKNKSVFMPIDKSLGYSLLKNLFALSDNQIELKSANSSKSKQSNKKSDKKSVTTNQSKPSVYKSEQSIQSEQSSDCYSTEDYTSDTESDYDDYENNDDVRVVIGHVPILMEPCNNFTWSKEEYMTIKNFKSHLLNCKKCNKIDNNDTSIYNYINNSVIHCSEMKNEEEIESCLKYYYNCSTCKFELIGNDRKNDHIYIFRIVSKHHIYHNCLLIMW